MIPVRKKGSVGPHLPKVSRGLESSMGNYDSPRFRQPSSLLSGQSRLESSSEESTSEEESSDDVSDDDDEDDESLEDATKNRPSGY